MVSTTTDTEVQLLLRKIKSDLGKGRMPDLTGMNLKDAIYLLENYGLIVKSLGSGSIQKQSIRKGELFEAGSIIHLQLI